MSRRHRVAIIGAGIGALRLEGCPAHPEMFEAAVICLSNLARHSRQGLRVLRFTAGPQPPR